MCRTLAFLPNNNREQWLDRYAHWLNSKQRANILRLGPYWYAARSLGEHLELCDEDREDLQAWSIEACDVTPEQRVMINQEKHRKRQESRRRKAGAKPRAESISRTKPWIADGISRSEWYRRRKSVGTSSCQPSLKEEHREHEFVPCTPSEPQASPDRTNASPFRVINGSVHPSNPREATC